MNARIEWPELTPAPEFPNLFVSAPEIELPDGTNRIYTARTWEDAYKLAVELTSKVRQGEYVRIYAFKKQIGQLMGQC